MMQMPDRPKMLAKSTGERRVANIRADIVRYVGTRIVKQSKNNIHSKGLWDHTCNDAASGLNNCWRHKLCWGFKAYFQL